jgi:hypothetical protein
MISCATAPETAGALPAQTLAPVSIPALPPYAGDGVSFDRALSDIAAYYRENLPANTRIALVNFESDYPLLSEYIFEELSIYFESSRSFVLVDRRDLELIQWEMEYQFSGAVSDESAQSIWNQFGPQTLVYGKITALGGDYRLIVHATDVEPASGVAGAGTAGALYSGAGNPWRFTVQTDRSGGEYRYGDYMTLRIYAERDAYFKITHIDVNGNAQVICPRAPSFNLAEQCAIKEIVAKGSPEHFPADAESFFSHGGLSREMQSRFSHHIQIFRRMVRPRPAPVFPKTYVRKPVRTVLD